MKNKNFKVGDRVERITHYKTFNGIELYGRKGKIIEYGDPIITVLFDSPFPDELNSWSSHKNTLKKILNWREKLDR